MKVTNINNDRRAVLVIPLKDYNGKAAAYVKAVRGREAGSMSGE